MPLLDEAAHALRILLKSEELKSFVCHSLGGLIVKSIIRSANEQKADQATADLHNRIRQIIFIATPHTGSGKAGTRRRRTGNDSATVALPS
jgi:triacylglycerol esterase/lipase EstA (alpha/beta hydrolase family)